MSKRPGLFGRIIRAALKTAGASFSDEAFWSTWTPQGAISATGSSEMQKSVGDGTGIDVIMAPVLWIARRMAESPIGVNIKDDPEIHFDHDVARLLKNPNPWYAGSTMRMALAINYLMDGNGYLRKIRDKRDKVAFLVFIPAWCIQPVIPPLNQGYVEYYEYNPGGLISADQSQKRLIESRDIVHLRFGIDPNFTRKGISPLKILMREIYSDVQGSTMTAMLLKNAGVMGVIIAPKAGVTISKPTETKKYIQEEFKGARQGNAMVMTAPTDVTYMGVDSTKMDLGKLREIPEERICAVLNLPSAVAGFGTGMQQTKVGATLVELRAMAYEDCIIPNQNSWCDEFDLQLMPDFEDDPQSFSTQFDNSKVRVLQPDDNAIAARLNAQLLCGGILLSEYRESIGRKVNEKTQDVFYIPNAVTITPADQLDTPPPPPPATPVVDPNAQADPAAGKANGNGHNGKRKSLHGPARMTPKLSRLAHRLTREERVARKRWQGELTGEFKAFAELCAQKFSAAAKRRDAKAGDLKAEPDWSLIGDEALQDAGPLVPSFGPHYLLVAKNTFASLNEILSLGVNLTDHVEAAMLRQGGRRMGLIDLNQQTRTAMFEAISEARAEGEGAAGIVARIIDTIAAGPWTSAEIRAQVIARTETKYAQNYSSLEAYRSSDTVSDVLVFDAQLGPTDEECEALNGTTVSLEEAQALMESEHPNGTRSFAPVVGGPSEGTSKTTGGNGKTMQFILQLPPVEKVTKTITMRRVEGAMVGTIEEEHN